MGRSDGRTAVQPDEIARAVAFLTFEATSATGAELPVEGGASQL